MTSFKRQQAKYVKKPYYVRNWAEYEGEREIAAA